MTALTIGTRVTYANGLYEVVRQHGDLLDIVGVAADVVISPWDGDGSGTARPWCRVLASDVTVCAAQSVPGAECGPKHPTATQHTGDGDGGDE